MDYKLDEYGLEIQIGLNVFKNHGKYFEDTENHKEFFKIAERLNEIVLKHDFYGHVHFDIDQRESSIPATLSIFSQLSLSKNSAHSLIISLLNDFFSKEQKKEIKAYCNDDYTQVNIEGLSCPLFPFTELNIIIHD